MVLSAFLSKNQKQTPFEKMEVQKDFGTITEFFFLALEFLSIGYVSLQDSFVEMN